MNFSLRNLLPGDMQQLEELQRQYCSMYTPRTPVPAQLYISPYFAEGNNVMAAFNPAGSLLAYAPYFPQNDLAWVEVEASPELENPGEVKDALWNWLFRRAQQDGIKKLCFQYYPIEREAICFAKRKAGRYSYSIYTMRRDLKQEIPEIGMPDGFSLRQWRMETDAEQIRYLEARNECFPEAPTSLQEWQFFAGSPIWQQGINMAAFDGEQLAASVLVFFEPGNPIGSTEYIFTRPNFRKKGISQALLAEALRYLKDRELTTAALEVRALNQAALSVYRSLGYEVTSESQVYEVQVIT